MKQVLKLKGLTEMKSIDEGDYPSEGMMMLECTGNINGYSQCRRCYCYLC